MIYVCILNDLYFERNAWECLRLSRKRARWENDFCLLGIVGNFHQWLKKPFLWIRHSAVIRQLELSPLLKNRKEIDAVNGCRVVNILFSKNLRFTKAIHFFLFRGSLKAARKKFHKELFRRFKIFALTVDQDRKLKI